MNMSCLTLGTKTKYLKHIIKTEDTVIHVLSYYTYHAGIYD